jgi:uncharacterized membrane protein YgcG
MSDIISRQDAEATKDEALLEDLDNRNEDVENLRHRKVDGSPDFRFVENRPMDTRVNGLPDLRHRKNRTDLGRVNAMTRDVRRAMLEQKPKEEITFERPDPERLRRLAESVANVPNAGRNAGGEGNGGEGGDEGNGGGRGRSGGGRRGR